MTFADERLKYNICSLCGNPDPDSKEHVIPKVFLEEPFPKNLPTTISCRKCNESYSKDEQYLACLIECVISGTTDPDKIERKKISRTLKNSSGLRKMLKNDKTSNKGDIFFTIDSKRVENVLIKLARAHLFYYINEINYEHPEILKYEPIINFTSEEKTLFFKNEGYLYPEIGSRYFISSIEENIDWHIIQEDSYQFLIESKSNLITVKILIRNYLACIITW